MTWEKSKAVALTTTVTDPSGSEGGGENILDVKIQTLLGITRGGWNAPGIDPEPVLSILTTTRIPGRFYLTGTETARLLGPMVLWLVPCSGPVVDPCY